MNFTREKIVIAGGSSSIGLQMTHGFPLEKQPAEIAIDAAGPVRLVGVSRSRLGNPPN